MMRVNHMKRSSRWILGSKTRNNRMGSEVPPVGPLGDLRAWVARNRPAKTSMHDGGTDDHGVREGTANG